MGSLDNSPIGFLFDDYLPDNKEVESTLLPLDNAKLNYKFRNTEKFRAAAICFEKNGYYCNEVKDSRGYYEFWDKEFDKIENGVTIDGVYICGLYYFFLNYCPIEQIKTKEIVDSKGKISTYSERVTAFPRFWDAQYILFTAIHIARYGMSIDAYDELPIDLGLIRTEENLSGGKNFLFLAPRAMGKSFVQGSISAYRYFTIRKSATFMIAGDKTYLTGDGAFTKFYSYVTHINTHTAFSQYNDVKNDFNGMHLRASYRDALGTEQGRMSEVIGVTVGDGKVDKVRGKRGYFIIEEIGSLKCASQLWKTITPGVNHQGSVYGQIIGMGTGGDIGEGAEFMEKAFYQPAPFDILQFENKWDNGMLGLPCAFFLPATYSTTYMDNDGNTDHKKSLQFIEKRRTLMSKSKDAGDLIGAKAEFPLTPSEALLRMDSTLFPKADLLQWKQEIIAGSLDKYMATHGNFVETANGVKFVPDMDAVPVNKFPYPKNLPQEGCVTIFETPFENSKGKIPQYLYNVVVDPYMHESGSSLGAIYVVKNINVFSKPDDCIVACYVGRPATMEAFHKLCKQFADYYGALIGIENNAGQTLMSWFKSNKYLKYLAPEFELSFNESIPKSSTRRGFGMHIDKRKKDIGLAYLAEWLSSPYYITEDGIQLYNYHKIYDLGLLEEFINYNDKGNFDRISAMIVAMYMMKEVDYKYAESMKKDSSPLNNYFNTALFG